MFKVFNGDTFITDVYATDVQDAVAMFRWLYCNDDRQMIVRPLGRRLWQVVDREMTYELAQVM